MSDKNKFCSFCKGKYIRGIPHIFSLQHRNNIRKLPKDWHKKQLPKKIIT